MDGTPVANASGSPILADLFIQLGRLEHLRGRLQPALDRYHQTIEYTAHSPAHLMNIQLHILLVLVEMNQLDQARAGSHELMAPHDQAHPLHRVSSLPEELRDLADLIGGLLDICPLWPSDGEPAAWQALHRHDIVTACRLYGRSLQSARSGVRQARLALALGMLADPECALAGAQREMLGKPDATPLNWAVFALFGDAAGLPAPGWLGRWRARRRQRRHELAFPGIEALLANSVRT